MTHPRLSLALEGAEALPPSGGILVIGPRAGADLPLLDKDRTVVVQGFRPDHDALSAAGWKVVPEPQEAGDGHAAALIFVPRARAAARALVADASRRVVPGGRIWVDGQKTDGIDTIARDVRGRTVISAPIAKAHGKIFSFAAAPVFDDWAAADLFPTPDFVTRPGVFSAEKVDHGSALLAAALPAAMGGAVRRVADLGAGWGWLSAQALARPDIGEMHLIEADHAALGCARRNVTDPRARFHWADATRFNTDQRFDAVISNPPFHAGRAADPALGAAFIGTAARMLAPAGVFCMVANRHLPYEAVLARHFRETVEIGGDGGFKVLRAARPVPAPRPGR